MTTTPTTTTPATTSPVSPGASARLTSGAKAHTGYFFEDYTVGQILEHAVPRTVTDGDRALYTALYPTRFALASADTAARACGLPRSPLEELIAFHVVFGKTVPDLSLNAVANLGYAEGRFLAPVYPGQTLSARSEVIGLKETSSGSTGIVWVRTQGLADGDPVLEYSRWVLVAKRDPDAPAADPVVPSLASAVAPTDLVLPQGLTFKDFPFAQTGEPHRLGDYEVGEVIDHLDAVTVEEADHLLATRLWQNTARVHFDTGARPDGRRLIYGGHVISLARALSVNGLANAQPIVAINAGTHVAPCFAGDTVRAWSEVLDKAPTSDPSVGALRLRLVASKGPAGATTLKGPDGKYAADVLLDLDIWTLIPA